MTARDVDLEIIGLALIQHGAFSRSQALALGATERIIDRRVANEIWLPRAEGVYVMRGFPPAWHQDLWVACLASIHRPVVSHEAAAALHGLDTFRPGPVVVTVPHGDSRLTRLATVHQSRNLPEDHVEIRDRLAVTTVARTIVDLAMVIRRARLDHVINDTAAAGLVTDEELFVCFETVARRGRRGARVLRTILNERSPGDGVSATKLERLLLDALKGGGLPRPEVQFPLPGRERPEGTVDVAYPDQRLIIEADGRRYHTRKRDFAVDRERDIVATLARWRTLRFTWDDLTKRPEWVVDCVRRALLQRAA